MNNKYYLSLRELFSESILRNLILFFILYIFTISQVWDSIFLLLFPLITFSFSVIFNLINENKWRIQFNEYYIIYNPLGSEKKHANRLFFSSLLQLIFIFWIGAESFYHPQLINDYSFLFIIIFIFIYTFTYFWIFIDIWNYCHIIIDITKYNVNIEKENINHNTFIHNINLRKIKLILYLSMSLFLILNAFNWLFTFLTYNAYIPGYNFILPGTGIESSQPLLLHFIFYPLLLISPIFTIILLFLVYRESHNINPESLKKFLNSMSENLKILILEKFRTLNKTFINNLDRE